MTNDVDPFSYNYRPLGNLVCNQSLPSIFKFINQTSTFKFTRKSSPSVRSLEAFSFASELSKLSERYDLSRSLLPLKPGREDPRVPSVNYPAPASGPHQVVLLSTSQVQPRAPEDAAPDPCSDVGTLQAQGPRQRVLGATATPQSLTPQVGTCVLETIRLGGCGQRAHGFSQSSSHQTPGRYGGAASLDQTLFLHSGVHPRALHVLTSCFPRSGTSQSCRELQAAS